MRIVILVLALAGCSGERAYSAGQNWLQARDRADKVKITALSSEMMTR
jgi:hypothetical protein